MGECRHCGLDSPEGRDFCCPGCEAAFHLVEGLGLDGYYARRSLDPAVRALRPDADGPPVDYGAHVTEDPDGTRRLALMVEGIHCAACVWLIESVLARQPGVVSARVNMTTRRLVVNWRDAEADAVVAPIGRLGYRLVPFDPALIGREAEAGERELLRAMAVAGFAAGNVMLFSVSVWAGHSQGMGEATRELMYWLSALIALPAIAYAGVPFYRSAFGVLRAGHVNMDVPISLAVLLAGGMSLFETVTGGEHAYFDSAVTLLFFLLIGRYLDRRARGKARSAAEHLVGLGATAVTVIDAADGRKHLLPPSKVAPGMLAFAAAGDRIAVDGHVAEGRSDVDSSLVSGESLPEPVGPGDAVFAGARNLSAPLTVRVSAVGEGTLLAEIVRLMEAAEGGRATYVALADRVAGYYAPVVHGLALSTFLGWWVMAGAPWQEALLTAISVLIITCPCALALAVPVVQVIASGRLFRQGILVKSGTALERLARVDAVAFDKTGTLTLGRPELVAADAIDDTAKRLAASLAAASRHPLARALSRAVPGVALAAGVEEVPGCGLRRGDVRLGSAVWTGIEAAEPRAAPGPELWLTRPGQAPVRFAFTDRPRPDAAEVVAALKTRGLPLVLLSGDRGPAVDAVADALGIAERHAACAPADKTRRLQALAAEGRRVMMVGDGLNDAPALAAAYVSMSPSTAVDVSQTAADAVFQGDRLAPVVEALAVARRADSLVKQNFVLALLYNAVTIPLAVAGYVTPLVAAAAMSSSSILVIANALRLGGRRG